MLPRTFLWVPLLLFLPGMLFNAAPAGAESLFVGPPAVFPESPGLRAEAEELTRQAVFAAQRAYGQLVGLRYGGQPEEGSVRVALPFVRQEGASILTARLASGRASGGASASAWRQE